MFNASLKLNVPVMTNVWIKYVEPTMCSNGETCLPVNTKIICKLNQ